MDSLIPARERAAFDLLEQDLPEQQRAYFRSLVDVLADRVVTLEEKAEVRRLAREARLNAEQLLELHRGYLQQVAAAYLCEGEPGPAELRDLTLLARLLALSETAVNDALAAAKSDADQIAGIILNEPSDRRPTDSTASASLSLITAPVGWVQGMTGSAGQLFSRLAWPSVPAVTPPTCSGCQVSTEYSLQFTAAFPLHRWVQVFVQAGTISPLATAVSAARLALMDKQLLSQTGEAILPVATCQGCGQEADRWVTARILLARAKTSR